MQDTALEKRVDRLEEAMMELVYQSRKTEMEIERLAQEMKEFKQEMKEFKDEMRRFKEEAEKDRKALREEMNKFKEEAEKDRKVLKKELEEFKQGIDKFRENMEKERREATKEWNKRWGELANKLGTIVEDIISPAIAPIIKKYFHCEPEQVSIRVKKRKKDLRDEFDAIAICEDKVFLIEVKATPKPEYIFDFINQKAERFKKLFPELLEKRLILIFASLRLEKDIINLLTKHKIFGMAYREWEYMDILNFDEVIKQIPND